MNRGKDAAREVELERREFLLAGLLSAPLGQFLARLARADDSAGAAQSSDKTVIFLPGFMGSVLTKNAVDIWPAKVSELYHILVKNPNLLRYSGTPADNTRLLDVLEFWRYWGLTGDYPVYAPIAGALSHIFQNMLVFTYDWRQSMLKILGDFRNRLTERAFEYDGEQAKRSGRGIYLVGHSMGGVLSLLAVAQKLIHPDDLRALVLIGAPLGGSPKAFRATFDATGFMLLKQFYGIYWRKNAKTAWRNMHSVIQSFPSIYQLMPPIGVRFVYRQSDAKWTHPFVHGGMEASVVQEAKKVHSAIAQAISQLPVPLKRVHIIHGSSITTDRRYYVKMRMAAGGTPLYEMAAPGVLTSTEGDGTVLDGSVYSRTMANKGTRYPYPAVDHMGLLGDEAVLQLLGVLLP